MPFDELTWKLCTRKTVRIPTKIQDVFGVGRCVRGSRKTRIYFLLVEDVAVAQGIDGRVALVWICNLLPVAQTRRRLSPVTVI